MPEKSSNVKSSQHNSGNSSPSASAGPNGIAISPPSYDLLNMERTSSEAGSTFIQMKAAASPAGHNAGTGSENRTGLPDTLKSGIESLSGLAMDDVQVHYNSPRPAQLQAFAYTQGTQIHVAPGQERHLPHEAWHVVQQKQGRVRSTLQAKGVQINDDGGLEHEADIMGAQIMRMRDPHLATKVAQRKDNPLGVIQRVKVPPNGNFPRYVAGGLTNSNITAGLHPDQAEVATESAFDANSVPVNSLGWAALNHNNYTLQAGAGVGINTRIDLWPRIEQNGNNLTRMHLIHHELATNANHNINNIVLGPQVFNGTHVSHVENFLKDTMLNNFYTTTGSSLNALLLPGENLGVAGPAHANAGRPYVVGAAPTFPNSLLTGVTLASNNGVPPNAKEITTNEDILDQHVAIWYEVVPVFGMTGANLYASMVATLNNHYLNNRPGAVKTGENVPAGILGGAGNMMRDMADALAGIYATALTLKGSFFTPDPAHIPALGVTADNLPWKDSRWPKRTLNNPAARPYWEYDMRYDAGMGILTAAAPTNAQL